MTDLEILKSFIPIAQFIAAISGPCCEVAIHNLNDIEHSIIFIENGHLTNRTVGDAMIDFNSQTMLYPKDPDLNFHANYGGIHTIGERVFRFSTFYIRNTTKRLIGLLNTNYDITGLIQMQHTLASDLIFMESGYHPTAQPSSAPSISVKFLIEQAFDNAMSSFGFSSTQALSKTEKIEVVKYFYEHAYFTLRGSVGILAKKLNVSEPTIYRYRNHIKD